MYREGYTLPIIFPQKPYKQEYSRVQYFVLREYQSGILYPVKLFLRTEGEIKTF